MGSADVIVPTLEERIEAASQAVARLVREMVPGEELRIERYSEDGEHLFTLTRTCPQPRAESDPEAIKNGLDLVPEISRQFSLPRSLVRMMICTGECPCGDPGATPCWRMGGKAPCPILIPAEAARRRRALRSVRNLG